MPPASLGTSDSFGADMPAEVCCENFGGGLVFCLPFWPECLHIKFQKIYLCKAIFYIFAIAFRKIKICNVIFYARQINYPEFKYVISWWSKSCVLAEALLPTRVSCTFPHSWPYLWCKFSTFPTCFGPLHQESWVFWGKILVFHRICSLLTQNAHVFPHFWPSCANKSWVLHTICPLLMPNFPRFGPIAPTNPGSSQDLFSSDEKISHVFSRFPLLMQNFPRVAPALSCCDAKCPTFFQVLSSSDAKFPTFFHISDSISPRNLGFSQDLAFSDWVLHRTCPLLMQNFPCFFHIFGPTAPRIFKFHRIFSSSDATFTTCANKQTNKHTHTHTWCQQNL